MYFDTVPAAHVLTLPKFAFTSGSAFNAHIRALVDNARNEHVAGFAAVDNVCDWTSFYHLCASRAALLGPVWAGISSPVLEVGCGTGALTQHLGSRGLHVCALDSSPERRQITQERCAHLPTVAVTDSSLLETATRIFNTVLLVGVLEYSPERYPEIPALDACATMLRRARSVLAEDGRLILAIENRLGAKYFAGAGEDHNEVAYYGLESRYRGLDAVTLGRRQLSRLLSLAGFEHKNWFYPFPDYKFPVCILSERVADPEVPFDPRPLLRWASRFATDSSKHDFDIGRALGSIWQNGLLGELSNSFLVECSRKAMSADPDQTLAWINSPPGIAHEHAFSWLVEGSPNRATIHQSTNAWRLTQESGASPTAPPFALLERGSHLSRLQDLLTSSQPVDSDARLAYELTTWLEQWLDALAEEANLPNGAITEPCQLETRLLGATPGNLFHDTHSISFGPLPALAPVGEWLGPADVHWIVYRGLLHAGLQLRGNLGSQSSKNTVRQLIRTIGAPALPGEGTLEMANVRARETFLLRQLTPYAKVIDLVQVESLQI